MHEFMYFFVNSCIGIYIYIHKCIHTYTSACADLGARSPLRQVRPGSHALALATMPAGQPGPQGQEAPGTAAVM